MSILYLVQLLFNALNLLILAGVVLSWVELGAGRATWLYHPAVNLIRETSFRLIRPFRNLFEKIGFRTGPIDFSPMVAVFVYYLLEQLVLSLLVNIGIR